MTRELAQRERGQSTIEFALVLPVLFLVMLGAAQVGLVVLAKFAATHTAREVARVVSIDRGADPVEVAAEAAPFGSDLDVSVEYQTRNHGELAVVTVRVQVRSLAAALIPHLEVEATVAMAVESPP